MRVQPIIAFNQKLHYIEHCALQFDPKQNDGAEARRKCRKTDVVGVNFIAQTEIQNNIR